MRHPLLRRIARASHASPATATFNRLDHVATYREHTRRLREELGGDERALETAIGGEWDAIGFIERELLVDQGLLPAHSLADLGCGSGRLAVQLRDYLTGPYLGTDVVPELLEHARRITARPNFTFALTESLTIPADDGTIDFACAFSLFTHLIHEETFVLLRECERVLRPGGKVVFSFLEFRAPAHWAIFEANVDSLGARRHHDQFIGRDAITTWAEHLAFSDLSMYDAADRRIPLSHPVRFDNGVVMTDFANLGQSVAVLTRTGAG